MPLVLELKTNNAAAYIDYTGKFVYGNQKDGARFVKWLKSVRRELRRIVWNWESGKDEFKLINKPVG